MLGAVFATVLAKAGNVSLAYTTIPQVLNAWYGSQYRYGQGGPGPLLCFSSRIVHAACWNMLGGCFLTSPGEVVS